MKTATVIVGHPGVGKSHELIRIATEYAEAGARILMLSFTKVAAKELAERIPDNNKLTTSTIHSFAFQAVRNDIGIVVDTKKIVEFGNAIGVPMSGDFDINCEQERVIEEGDEAMSIISKADACGVPHAEEYLRSDRPLARDTFDFISSSYVLWKKRNNMVDFTGMLDMYIAMALPIPYDVVIVDEAQDLSNKQWAVVNTMLPSIQHVIVAGDPDQQLFTWGGASDDGMHKFAEETDAHVYSLTQSYRIPRAVHTVAMSIRNQIKNKHESNYRPRDHEGAVNNHVTPYTLDIQAESDTLVLYRTHALRREIESVLLEQRIPYVTLNGMRDPWHGPFGRAVSAYNKSAAGTKLSAPEKRSLLRYYDSDHVTTKAPWWSALQLPNRFLDYMVDTEGKSSKVRLSTIHGAKGKEADNVILYTGMTQRVVEGMQRDPDPEHRVFYVGVTRAKSQLDLVSGENNYEW